MKAEDVLGRIEQLCREKGWSYYKLAKESKMPYSSLYNILRRKSFPQIDTLEQICEGLQITLCDFFCDEKMEEQLTSEDYELIELNRRLSRNSRDRVLAYAQALADTEEEYPNRDRRRRRSQ